MVRQYIGARYVPKFYENSDGNAEWRAGVIYEPLTIVTYNGNSYTSKKPVPAEIGNPSANSAYWVATGVYNEQVEALRQELESVSGSVDNLETEITTKQTNDANRRYILIGDSYNVGTSANPALGWGEHFKQILNLSNDRWYNSAHGGSGFVAPTYTFQQQIADLIPNVTDPETITDIVIAGGYNDHHGTRDDITAAISAAVTALRTAFPNAHIYITMCGCSTRADATIRVLLPNVAAFYRYGSGMCGVTYFDTFRMLKMSPLYMSSDEVHPTNNGYLQLAMEIVNGINGGEMRQSDTNNTAVLTPVNGITLASGAQNWPMRVHNNYINVYAPNVLNTFNLANADSKPTATTFYKLGTFTNAITHGLTATDVGSTLCGVLCTGYLMRGANNEYVNFKGILSFNYNALWIMIREVENGTYMNMSNVNSITLDPDIYKLPIDFV